MQVLKYFLAALATFAVFVAACVGAFVLGYGPEESLPVVVGVPALTLFAGAWLSRPSVRPSV